MISSSLERVAVVMVSTVGNAVHALPVLASLKRHHPEGKITWIAQPSTAELVRGHPAVDELVLFERKRGVAGFLELRQHLANRHFDLVLNLQPYLKTGIVTALAHAPVKLGYDRARARELTWLFSTHRLPPRPRAHVQDEYLEFLDALRVPRHLHWGLGPTAEETARYAPLLPPSPSPTVALVVGTTRREKEWPAERYAALVDRLHEDLGARVVVVGGRSAREEAAAAEIAARAIRAPIDLREWDLRRLAFLLDRADVVVTPDTGPLHLAVALDTPTVALMGFTNPKRHGPYRRFGELLVDAYGDPGEDYSPGEGNRAGRMARITVAAVMERVRLAMSRYGRRSAGGQSAP